MQVPREVLGLMQPAFLPGNSPVDEVGMPARPAPPPCGHHPDHSSTV